jgi:Holliday junction resolvase-like predicted endonuclease
VPKHRSSQLEISKSTRHSKITGTFGEELLLYWLSKHGFECASVDHTGIDLIARNPHTAERMGISVKSRSRTLGTEEDYISIPRDNFDKVQRACDAFGCVPYFGIVADAADVIRVFVLSMAHLLQLFPCGERISAWKMTKQHLDRYYADPEIIIFELTTRTHNWWKPNIS